MTRTNKTAFGRLGEEIAARYLSSLGMEILSRHFRTGHGEIDIICRDGNTLVFVEVKTSKSNAFGPPETWVDKQKQRKIGQVAEAYLHRHYQGDIDCRFDVVTVQFRNFKPQINYIKDAFWLEDELDTR